MWSGARSTGVSSDEWGSCGLAVSSHGRYLAFTHQTSSRGGCRLTVVDRYDGSYGAFEHRQWESLHLDFSDDGRWLLFTGARYVEDEPRGQFDVVLADPVSGSTTVVSVSRTGGTANDWSTAGGIALGRHVVFSSGASNLVAGDTNEVEDVFVRDLRAGTTRRVSVAPGGAQADGASRDASISADGRRVLFTSSASNLVPGDTNGGADAFVHDLRSGTTRRVSVSTSGRQARGDSQADGLSGNGRLVLFTSTAGNLVADDSNGSSDVFVRDTVSGSTRRVSVSGQEEQAAGDSYGYGISADGRFVGFLSAAGNVAPDVTPGAPDAFVRDLAATTTHLVSRGADGKPLRGGTYAARLSGDGRHVLFGVEYDDLGYAEDWVRDAIGD